jgi:hypothetical protein
MDTTKAINKALKNVTACFSFKGHDFCCVEDRNYVKKTTHRAQRRLNKAIIAEAV